MAGVYYSTTLEYLKTQEKQYNDLFDSYNDKLNKLIALNEKFNQLEQSYNQPTTEKYVESSSKAVKTTNSKKTKSKKKTRKKKTKAGKKSYKSKPKSGGSSGHHGNSGGGSSSSSSKSANKMLKKYATNIAKRNKEKKNPQKGYKPVNKHALHNRPTKGYKKVTNRAKPQVALSKKAKKDKKRVTKQALGMTLFAWKK